MSHQISGENAQGVFVPHSLNENSESCSINDMEISCTNSTVKTKKNSREITRSDSTFEEDSKNVEENDGIPTKNEELDREPDDGCIDENFILKVSHLDISDDKAVNAAPTISQGSSQDLMSESLKSIKKHTDSSDSSDNDDNTNITLKGLRFDDLGNDDEFVDSDEESESESEEYYTEDDDDEIQMKEVAKFGIKKRKVDREESWLSVLGVDKVSTELPHISTLELNNKEEFTHMGDLECVIDRIVTIAGLPGMPAYDLDTLLFLEEGQKILGYVLDVMGPISAPVYVVPMSSTQAIRDLQLRKGTKVYCAPKSKYTKYVLLQELMKMRRSESSWTADAETPSECPQFSEEGQGHLGKTEKDKNRNCSQERYRQFVRDMNRANHRDTRLHKMADSHRNHLERMGGMQSVNRQLRDSRTRNQSSGTKSHSEGRRSRPLYRNNAHGVGASEPQSWTVMNPAATTAPNCVPVLTPFNPSLPPPNCADSGYYLPSEDSLFSSFVGFIPSQNFNSQDFERSVSRPNIRQNNLPGPSNESWFN